MKEKQCAEVESILAVDKDEIVHESQVVEWQKYGVGAQRVETMSEAIVLVSCTNHYLFVAINEDTIPDFMTQLPVLRNATDLPIFVLSSTYTFEKKIAALDVGVDIYEAFPPHASYNVLVALKTLEARKRWRNARLPAQAVLYARGIILSQVCRRVFVEDVEVVFGKKEFALLEYLMQNSGEVVAYQELITAIWGEEYSTESMEILWNLITRIRRKLAKVSPKTYIRVVNGIGYQFVV